MHVLYIDGLVKDCSNSNALAMELLQSCTKPLIYHDDVIKWKHFPRYWPFGLRIHRSQVNSLHKGQWRATLMFSLIYALNKRLGKQLWGWWFETPSCSSWRHWNVLTVMLMYVSIGSSSMTNSSRFMLGTFRSTLTPSLQAVELVNLQYNNKTWDSSANAHSPMSTCTETETSSCWRNFHQ